MSLSLADIMAMFDPQILQANKVVTSFTPLENRNLLSTAWSVDVAASLEEDESNTTLGSSKIFLMVILF